MISNFSPQQYFQFPNSFYLIKPRWVVSTRCRSGTGLSRRGSADGTLFEILLSLWGGEVKKRLHATRLSFSVCSVFTLHHLSTFYHLCSYSLTFIAAPETCSYITDWDIQVPALSFLSLLLPVLLLVTFILVLLYGRIRSPPLVCSVCLTDPVFLPYWYLNYSSDFWSPAFCFLCHYLFTRQSFHSVPLTLVFCASLVLAFWSVSTFWPFCWVRKMSVEDTQLDEKKNKTLNVVLLKSEHSKRKFEEIRAEPTELEPLSKLLCSSAQLFSYMYKQAFLMQF